MNKDYLEYQYSKSKKLTERAFKLRIGMLVVSMLACAGIMASSAFALFKCDINRSTTLTAAQFAFTAPPTVKDGAEGEKIVTINTTDGVVGYCKITIIDPDKVQHWYYTEAFSTKIELTITAAAECEVIVSEPHWGYPRDNLSSEAQILSGRTINLPVTVTIDEPETEASSGGGGQDVSQEQQDNETDNTPTENATENNDEVLETPMLSVSPSVNKEQTTVTESAVTEKEITSVVEKSETTVTPSVSEEKIVENNSTVTEAPVTSTPLSDNNSDSGTLDSSANSSDSGTSFGSVSSGSDASPAVTSSSSSDGGGE